MIEAKFFTVGTYLYKYNLTVLFVSPSKIAHDTFYIYCPPLLLNEIYAHDGMIKRPYNEAIIILTLHLFVTSTGRLVTFFSPSNPQFTQKDYQLIQPFCSLWSDTSKPDDSQFNESVQWVVDSRTARTDL